MESMALEAELKELKLGGLSSRAVAMGIDPDDVADAQDQDNPSEAVRSLITECERLKGELGQLKLGVPRPLLYPLSIIVPIPTTNTPNTPTADDDCESVRAHGHRGSRTAIFPRGRWRR